MLSEQVSERPVAAINEANHIIRINSIIAFRQSNRPKPLLLRYDAYKSGVSARRHGYAVAAGGAAEGTASILQFEAGK
jgi:hypothetical protein